jgi:hypothetical protein
MENKEEVIRIILERKWSAMENHVTFMRSYLDGDLDQERPDDVLKMMLESLSIIFGEINSQLSKLNKYPPIEYTVSDFVDMVIEAIGEEPIDKSNRSEVDKYVEDMRISLWGYVNYNTKRYLDLYMGWPHNANENESFIILRECLTIVMVECILRLYER